MSAVNALLKRLLAIHRGEPDKVPEGHKTVEQWGQEWGTKKKTTMRLLKAGVAKKILKTARYKVRAGKMIRPVDHYYEA